MNKKMMLGTFALLMAFLMLAGCNKNEQTEEPTESSVTVQSQETTNTVYLDPYVGDSDEDGISSDDTEATSVTTDETISATETTENNQETESTTEPTTEPTTDPSTEPTTDNTPETTKPSESGSGGSCCKYSEYVKMSPAEQQAYMESFASPMDFIAWAQQAEEEHKAHDDSIIVEGGDVNLGDYID